MAADRPAERGPSGTGHDTARPQTTYNVLVERNVRSDVGDIAFVLLGAYDARTAGAAKRAAARDFGLTENNALVAVSGRYWN